MILQALNRYYDILSSDPQSGIAPFGYSVAGVNFALNLSREGELLGNESGGIEFGSALDIEAGNGVSDLKFNGVKLKLGKERNLAGKGARNLAPQKRPPYLPEGRLAFSRKLPGPSSPKVQFSLQSFPRHRPVPDGESSGLESENLREGLFQSSARRPKL